jgi:hypothetical protein
MNASWFDIKSLSLPKVYTKEIYRKVMEPFIYLLLLIANILTPIDSGFGNMSFPASGFPKIPEVELSGGTIYMKVDYKKPSSKQFAKLKSIKKLVVIPFGIALQLIYSKMAMISAQSKNSWVTKMSKPP